MPIGFPSTPADNDPYPVIDPVWRYSTAAGAWIPIAGASGSTPVTARLTSLVGTDDFIAFRTISGDPVPHLVSATVIDTFAGGSGGPTAPAAFTSGQWDATPIAGGLRFSFPGGLPSDGGSTGTAIQYSVNSGTSWTSFSGGITTVDRDVAGLPATPQGCMVRLVNAIGNGPDSDLKTRTPLAGGTTYIDFTTLSSMTETANGGGGFDYEATAADGYAANGYTIADGATGGVMLRPVRVGSSFPIVGFYPTATGDWASNAYLILYHDGNNWTAEGIGNSSLTGVTPRTYAAGDRVRILIADEAVTVEIERSATPGTWLPFVSTTIARAALLHFRVTSFGASGAQFIQPQVYP
jgi:hypothetical protein